MTTRSRELSTSRSRLSTQSERLLVLDFGSQYAQLIARSGPRATRLLRDRQARHFRGKKSANSTRLA